MKKRIFFRNAVILTLTSLILRVVGIFLRIYIANCIGAEGMGLHALIFTVYTFASAIASSGMSLAVTRLVTDDFAVGGKSAVHAVLRKSSLLSLILGCSAMLILYLFSDAIATYALCDTRATLSLRILAIGLPFIAISACFKGYFMARRNAKTPSNSQLIEQVIRILSVTLFLRPMARHGLSYACAAVVIGNAVSEILACLYLWIGYKKDTSKMTCSGIVKDHIFSRLCSVFVPVAFTGHINTALHMAENLIVPQALTRYTHNSSLGLTQFGMLKGMALPTLFFPASFLTALSSLLVPEMSEYGARNQKKSIARTAAFTLRITIVSSILIAGIFMAYPKELAQLLYRDAEVGFYIAALAPIVPFMYLESIVTGILHGLGQQISTLKYNLANSALRISAVLFFVPKFGMPCFLWIMIFSNLYTSISCLHRLFRVANIHMQWRRWVVSPALCCAIALLACQFYNQFGSGLLHLLGGGILFISLFSVFAYISGTITHSDFVQMHTAVHRQKQSSK